MKFIHIITAASILTTATLVKAESKTENEGQHSEKPDIIAIAGTISSLMRDHHYDPESLKTEAYQAIEDKTVSLAHSSESIGSFVEGFNKLWQQQGPFSHVRLDFAKMDAVSLAKYLDSMEVGGQGASLKWEGDTAILTVNTMMGNDTIQQIIAAYQEIHEKGAKALVIDLRNNHGGAFAVKPLVAHLINQPLDTGYFLSQNWTRENEGNPDKAQLEQIEPWEGWSIRAFWADVVRKGVLRIQMQPAAQNTFNGPVCVLTSEATASAAELAADAMGQLENVVIIGETTAGQMLSQTMFDLAGNLQLSLPIADYFSTQTGRIESAGVSPDIEVLAKDAMTTAMKWLQENSNRSTSNGAGAM